MVLRRKLVILVALLLVVSIGGGAFSLFYLDLGALQSSEVAGWSSLLLTVVGLVLLIALELHRQARRSEQLAVAALRRRDAVLGAVSFAAERFLRSGSWREEIPRVLERLGEAARLHRVALLENVEDEGGEVRCELRHRWGRPRSSLFDLSSDRFREPAWRCWRERLSQGKVAREVDLPASERRRLGRHSRLAVPIFVRDEWWGFLDLEDGAERAWETAEIEVLRTSARLLGAALERELAEKAMIAVSRHEVSRTLAGGAAHDLNNLMVGVLGGADLLRREVPDRPETTRLLDLITRSAQEASHVTRQLVAFARGGKYEARALGLNEVVGEALQHKTFPPGIRVDVDLDPDLLPVQADAAQMGQVVLNLVANAAEATEGQGRIEVSTHNFDADDTFVRRHPGLLPGPHVLLAVEDDGCGMDDATRARIFEPFFSTKFTGRGLGLAAVYGIVKNHDGHIAVRSDERGSTFEVFLPAVAAGVAAGATAGVPAEPAVV